MNTFNIYQTEGDTYDYQNESFVLDLSENYTTLDVVGRMKPIFIFI